MGEAYYSLGLLLAEDGARLPEAAEQLAKAAELVPDNPRIHYNYGLALQKLDKPAEAERSLLAAYKLAPTNPDFLVALAILYQQQEYWDRAIRCAEQLVQLRRGDRAAQAFLRQITQQAEEAKKQEK
jgi:predicted Zn-dependent protease